ncbi:hypothetical protein [Actinoplanes sp. TBRC 11911]|uniref:hypothetical protein n=1 Tax=Actinoplanes sp. TBRC 11911 TaxID=2729386 RepID=UPI00200711CA|nr:hypothetical protein [Actinoplanes sp. TBRC 11911]
MADVRYDPLGFQVRFTVTGDDVPTILELAPLLAARGRRRGVEISRFVASLGSGAGVPRTWTEARPLLRPVLRGGTPGSSLSRPVLPFLSEFVVIDGPDTMTYVGPEQPAMWGVKVNDVFAAARANLSGATLQGAATEPVVVRFVDDGDAYWTSHLLLEHWLGRLALQVGGTPVAFAPERGTLLVTADGSDHLRGLFAQAEEIYAKTSRPISPMAYASDADGLPVPYAAPPGHPLHHSVERAERVLAVEEYARQAARLAEADRPASETVAELLLIGSDEQGWRTRAIWERDEPALLPEADELQIGEEILPWAELAARLKPVAGMQPARWAAASWPPAGPRRA